MFKQMTINNNLNAGGAEGRGLNRPQELKLVEQLKINYCEG